MNERTSVLHARYIILIVLAVALGIWIGEGLKARQSHMEGLYRPTPATSLRLDCGKEAAIACRAQARGERIK